MVTALTPLEQEFADDNSASWPMVLGPVYLGIGIDMICLGVVLCQFIYWKVRLEYDERWPLRALIYWLCLGSVGHTAFCQIFGFSVFVQGYGDHLNVFRGWWVKGDCLFEILLAMPIEALYAVRAYELWGRPRFLRYALPVVFAMSISIGIANLSLGRPDPVSSTSSPYFLAWVATLFLIDWLLSALIVVVLVRKRIGLAHTDRMVMRVVKLSAEAQLLPSLITAGLIVKALVAPKSMIVVVFIFIPKVWVICGLAVINFRKSLREDMEEERQRRQNTLNFVSTPDGEEAVVHTAVPPMPTLSLTGDRFLSPMSEKGQYTADDGYPSTLSYFNMAPTSSGDYSSRFTQTPPDGQGRTPSLRGASSLGAIGAPASPQPNTQVGARRNEERPGGAGKGDIGGGLGFGIGLSNSKSKSQTGSGSAYGEVEEEGWDMSFEEMLAAKS